MEYISVHKLFNNYSKYIEGYVFLYGYLNGQYIYNDYSCEQSEKIFCPYGHHLDLDYYLKKMNRLMHVGHVRLVGKVNDKMYRVKNINRIVKVELLNDNGEVVESIINEKIPLPKELKGKI